MSSNKLRIFISSPGDVGTERVRAHLVIQKLARDYRRFFEIEPVLWEYEPMLASGHFQDAIVPPTDVDILVLILWSRLGTPLPERTGVRDYKGLDGRVPVTGTEWEFESALAAYRAGGAPDLLAYRRTGDPGTSLADPVRRSEQERQWVALEAFWRRHFEDVGLFIAGSARYEFIDEFERKLHADLDILLQRRIRALLPSHAAEGPSWLKGSPFRGLTAYDFESAPVFFGRDASIAAGIARLAKAHDKGTAFLLVTGPSGSGKSSLACAGLLPALTAPKAFPGVGAWRRVVFRPGAARGPVAALADAILHATQPGVGLPEIAEGGVTPASLEAHLRAARSDASLPFRTALAGVARAQAGVLPHESVRVVILVDQLEEIATSLSVSGEERATFFEILSGLARSGAIFVIATLRSDFWHVLAADRGFVDLVEAGERLDLTAPDLAEMAEMIHRPAAAAGLAFETDPDSGLPLDALLAKEAAGEAGVLPMLSVCLDDLYRRDVERAGGGSTLTIASWRAIGGLRAAIHQRAEEVLGQLARVDPEAAASLPALLRASVTAAGSGEAVTARAIPLADFAPGGPVRRLIEAFLASDARLLVAEDRGRGPEVRVAHEALISDWARARDWIRDNRRDIESEALLAAMMRRYDAASDPRERTTALLEGLNLEQGLDLVARDAIAGDGALAMFIEASRLEAERATEREIARAAAAATDKLRQRRRFQMMALSSVAALVVGIMFIVVQAQTNKARLATAQAKRDFDFAQLQKQEKEAAEASRSEAVAATKRAEDANHRATESERRALASLTESRKALVDSLVAQTELDLSHFDIVTALTHALTAAETERTYAKSGRTETSDAGIWRALAANHEVLNLRREPDAFGWPFLFLGNDVMAYALSGGSVIAVDLSSRRTIWTTRPTGLERPFRMLFDSSRHDLIVAGGSKLFVLDVESRGHPKVFAFPSDIRWFDLSRHQNLLAVALDHAVVLVDAGDATTPATTISIPPDSRDNSLERVVFDRTGSHLYAVDSDRIVEIDVGAPGGAAHDVKLPPRSELPRRLSAARDLDAYGAQDRSVVFATGLDAGIADLAAASAIDLNARLGNASDASRRIVAVHYPDQRDLYALENLYAIARSRDQKVIEIGVDLVEPDRLLADGLLKIDAAFTAHSIDHCRIAKANGYLACHYSQVEDEGLVVWSSSDRSGREAAHPRSIFDEIDSAARDPDSGRVLAVKEGALVDAQAPATSLLERMTGWQLVAARSSFALLENRTDKTVMVGSPDVGVMTTLQGRAPVLDAARRRVYRIEESSVVAYDIAEGREVWRRPVETMPTSLHWRQDRLIATTKDRALVLAADTGLVLHASNVHADGSDVADVDRAGKRLAYRDRESVLRIADLDDGSEKVIPAASPYPTALAFSPDGATIFVGNYDGVVTAWRLGEGPSWRLASPLGVSSLSRPTAAFADYVPNGEVLHLFPSPDGHMVGIRRAGEPCADLVLHSTETGRELMRVVAPNRSLNAARAEFDSKGTLFIDWGPRSDMAMMNDVGVATIDALPQGPDEAVLAAKATLAKLTRPDKPGAPFRAP